MNAVALVLVFLFAVAVSRVLVRLSPIKLPLPLFQIAIGAALSLVGFKVQLDPDIFFLVFIPPLLFLDGWGIPKDTLRKDWRAILTLAFGLVIFTVIGLGFLIGAMIPAVPLAVAFAIAAILSPTDPVAVSAIASGTPVPSRLLNILKGESLFNDASGLVCFNFAVAAALTGHFSLGDATLDFLKMAAGGIAIGAVIAWGASATYHWLSRWIGEEPGTLVLVSILIPFAAYLLAERMYLSGVLAAVAAGISMHYISLVGHFSAVTRMRRSAVWDMLEVTLNGIIFVLLGEQLPGIIRSVPAITRDAGAGQPWRLAVYVVVITAALAILRLVWTWIAFEWAHLLAVLRGREWRRLSPRWMFFTAFAGVKGAITLAGILTLPLMLMDGTAFPARKLAIFLAMGVILLSLATASIGLPLVARKLQPADDSEVADRERDARITAAKAAIRRVEEARRQTTEKESDIEEEAAEHVVDTYRKRLELGGKEGDEARHLLQIATAERRLRLVALNAERDELNRLRFSHRIDDPLHRRLVRELDLAEATLASRLQPGE